MPTNVSIQKCSDYTQPNLENSINESLRLIGGIESYISPGDNVLLKPNMLAGKPPESAVTTHPEFVKAVIELVKKTGAKVTVGDSPGLGSSLKVGAKCGIAQICEETDTELINFTELTTVTNPNKDSTFKIIEVAKEVLSFNKIINLPKMKTHAQMYLTMGVKNMYGCIPGKRKHQWHFEAGTNTDFFASMILELCLFLNPTLTIMDAVTSMEGNGPGSGTPRHTGLIFASNNAVALDLVATMALKAKPMDIPILKSAITRSIIKSDLSDIQIYGEELNTVTINNFDFPPQISANFINKLPNFIEQPLRQSLSTRPVVNHSTCTLCNICKDVCPAHVISSGEKITIELDNCIRCYCCQEMCPENSISVQEGLLRKVLTKLR